MPKATYSAGALTEITSVAAGMDVAHAATRHNSQAITHAVAQVPLACPAATRHRPNVMMCVPTNLETILPVQ